VLLLLILGTSIFLINLHQGLTYLATQYTRAESLIRKLLLAAIAIIFLLGLIVIKGQQADIYDSTSAISILVSILILILVILLWQSSFIVRYIASSEQINKSSNGTNIDSSHSEAQKLTLSFPQQTWLEELLNLIPVPLLLIEPKTARVTFANQAANQLAGGDFPKGILAEDYHTAYNFKDELGNPIPNEKIPGVRVAHGEKLQGLEVEWHYLSGIYSLLVFADTLPAMFGYPATCVLVLQDITNLKQLEKDFSLGEQWLQILLDITTNSLPSQQPLALINIIYQKLAQQIDWDFYINYLVEDDSAVMQLASYRVMSQEEAKKLEWLKFGQGICGIVAQERRPISVENVQQSTDPGTEIIRSLGITAYCSYPLLAQGKLLGTFCFGSRSRSRFTESQRAIMQAVCDQIVITMERVSLISSLQRQTQEAQEINRMKDEFLAILTHELRSPLNAILGWSQMLRMRKLNSEQVARAVETIERNAKTQVQLVEDLLDISSIIRGKLQFQPRTCDLVPAIKSAIKSVDLAARAKDINLQFDYFWEKQLEKSQFFVCGDPDRLQQIFWNLLSNAIKFTPPGGEIEIRLSKVLSYGTLRDKDEESLKVISYAQVKVIDTGIGIAPSFLPYVFDRFRQADSSSTRSYGGLGVGLALVRHLVEMHGGSVGVDSLGENQGATFTVKLPLLITNDTENLTKTVKDISELPLEPLCISLMHVKVLVVDDEADCLAFMANILEQCQAEVQAVSSVSEALQIIAQNPPDVLISDICMPDEDGYSLIRKLRAQSPEQGGKIPAAALTGCTHTDDRLKAMQSGYQLYLPKPIEPVELVTVVAILVGHKGEIGVHKSTSSNEHQGREQL